MPKTTDELLQMLISRRAVQDDSISDKDLRDKLDGFVGNIKKLKYFSFMIKYAVNFAI